MYRCSLIILSFLMMAELSAQKIEKVFLDKNDTTRNCYTIIYPDSLPWVGYLFLVPGFGETAEDVLLQTKLPVETAKTSVIKRQVLVKINLWNDELLNYYGFWIPEIYSIAFTDEAQQGIVYWGEMDDAIGVQPDVWKYSIAISFFRTWTSTYYNHNVPVPTEFIQVSAGYYLSEMPEADQLDAMDAMYDWDTFEVDMDYLMNMGFIHPYSFVMASTKSYQNEDMATYATWIVCNSLSERQEILDTYPLVKKKYDLTLKFYKDYLKIDLEEFSKFWLNVTVE